MKILFSSSTEKYLGTALNFTKIGCTGQSAATFLKAQNFTANDDAGKKKRRRIITVQARNIAEWPAIMLSG